MAKCYRGPESIPTPSFNPGESMEAWAAREEAYIEAVRAYCKKRPRTVTRNQDLVGEVISFPRADGKALYMVMDVSPLSLIWLEIGDAWSIPEAHMRGLRIGDVRRMVDQDRQWQAFMAERTTAART